MCMMSIDANTAPTLVDGGRSHQVGPDACGKHASRPGHTPVKTRSMVEMSINDSDSKAKKAADPTETKPTTRMVTAAKPSVLRAFGRAVHVRCRLAKACRGAP
jgi:hypothetical protein